MNIIKLKGGKPPFLRPCIHTHAHTQTSNNIYSAFDDDLGDVCEKLTERLAPDWRTIATNLRLRDRTMNIIEKNNPGDVTRCLRLALKDWLKLNYNYERNGHPSWRMLAKAVQNLDGALFNEILHEHPVG